MKRLLIGLVIGIAFGILFTTLILNRFISPLAPNNHVRVNVINKSQFLIRELLLTHEKGENKIKWIKPNSEAIILFKSGSENSFTIKVVYDNDSILYSKEKFVESGNNMTEIVTDKKIETKIDNL